MGQIDELRQWIVRRWPVNAEFSLRDVYRFEDEFSRVYPRNTAIQATFRNLLQKLRDEGTIRFVDDRGRYQRVK